jgi:hypothetical protein
MQGCLFFERDTFFEMDTTAHKATSWAAAAAAAAAAGGKNCCCCCAPLACRAPPLACSRASSFCRSSIATSDCSFLSGVLRMYGSRPPALSIFLRATSQGAM